MHAVPKLLNLYNTGTCVEAFFPAIKFIKYAPKLLKT